MVENIFKTIKSGLDTRPIYHRLDEKIVCYVFCSFLSLVLMKELTRRLNNAIVSYELPRVLIDLQALQEMTIEETGKKLIIRSNCQGLYNDVIRAVEVAIPPSIREV